MPVSQGDEATPFDDGALYDVFYEHYQVGLEFYLDLARTASGPVLDLACGTGRVMLPCLKAGIDVEGVDLSAGMLSRLKEKTAAAGFAPRLHQASMSTFHLQRRYALILISFNAFVHNLTADDQIATLKSCHDHLLPGGLLAFDTFFPCLALLTAPEGRRALEAEARHPLTGLPVRMYDTHRLDLVQQLIHSSIEIELLDASGNVTESHPSRSTTRYIYRHEMELLLQAAGFAKWQILGSYDGRPLERETDALIVKAWTADDE